jgi:phosphomannomutase/phosphomannomutase/phosphoglucomutase
VAVLDLGLGGTEQVYFATAHLQADGGLMVTASHNPKDDNGIKLVGRGSVPLSGDDGLPGLERAILAGDLGPVRPGGSVAPVDVSDAYVEHLLSYVDLPRVGPLTVVVDAGNGCAGLVLDRLEARLPVRFVKVRHDPDGEFPHGVPNPMLEANRAPTLAALRASGADLGLAWDGDFDRCFFYDEQSRFVEGYYLVGLLAQAMLTKHPGSRIIHDPRLTWNTREMVLEAGGVPVLSRCGHTFIKGAMREADAVYGGEMSAHHYFRTFAYCDSGMIPWLVLLPALSAAPLSSLVDERTRRYPVSGEINHRLESADVRLDEVLRRYGPQALAVDHTDGISLEFDTWRFNLRRSNTEPLVRLNVESRGDRDLMEEKTAELLALLC